MITRYLLRVREGCEGFPDACGGMREAKATGDALEPILNTCNGFKMLGAGIAEALDE